MTIQNNQTFDDKKKKSLIEKQTKLSKTFKDLSNKLSIIDKRAEDSTKKEVENDKRNKITKGDLEPEFISDMNLF